MTDDTLKLWQVIVYGIEHTIDEETLKAWILAGKIRQEDRVKKAGTNWTEARNVPRLRDLFAQAAQKFDDQSSHENTQVGEAKNDGSPSPRSNLSGYRIQSPSGVWQFEDTLIIEKENKLPNRCLKCNSGTDVIRLNYQFSCRPRWPLFLTPVIGPLLVTLILVLLSQHKQVEIGLCRSHYQTRYMASILGWVVFVPGFIVLVNSLRTNSPIEALICMLVLGVFGIVLAYFGQIAQVLEIRDSILYLKKVHPEYVKQFPVWPYTV